MEVQHARELLARERARIERAIAELVGLDGLDGELSHIDQHLADGATELFVAERDQGLMRRLKEELEAVSRAEARLAGGTYGRSVDSGLPIPDARLEVVPAAERTVDEQRRYERR